MKLSTRVYKATCGLALLMSLASSSITHCLLSSAPATLALFLFLRHPQCFPHFRAFELVVCPRMLLPQIFPWLAPYFHMDTSLNVTSLETSSPDTQSKVASPHTHVSFSITLPCLTIITIFATL